MGGKGEEAHDHKRHQAEGEGQGKNIYVEIENPAFRVGDEHDGEALPAKGHGGSQDPADTHTTTPKKGDNAEEKSPFEFFISVCRHACPLFPPFFFWKWKMSYTPNYF
jgi:hypothetical protein